MFPTMRIRLVLLAVLLARAAAPGSVGAQDDNEADHQALREQRSEMFFR